MYIDPTTYPLRPLAVKFDGAEVVVTLANGDVLRNPIAWHPWLAQASTEQRTNYELDAYSVYWPDLDEGLDIEGMRRGIPSDPTLKAEYYAQLETDTDRLIELARKLPAETLRALVTLVDQLVRQ